MGRATTRIFDERAFEQPAATLSDVERSAWIAGQATFQLDWTEKPGTDRSGLGPTFNAISCEACHTKNGRGRPPLANDDPFVTTLVRLTDPLSAYGDQLQNRGIPGVPAEGVATVSYDEETGKYGDGTPYTLVRPRAVITPNFGEFSPEARFSLRIAPQTIGMGFLEAIPEDTILAREDPTDRDEDGISGRAHRVVSVRTGKTMMGRFGWKASQPTVEEQSAAAFAGDLGLTSSLFPSPNCPAPQTACAEAADDAIELSESRLAAVTTFMRGTSVPARRGVDDPAVIEGKRLFTSFGCASCHAPSSLTKDGERIWPYTDLLLHDMGDGLADDRPDVDATGSEWRTPPLWGIGLLAEVSGHERMLHDGRARGAAEAILWHGGEASTARERFRTAASSDRKRLLAFLNSL